MKKSSEKELAIKMRLRGMSYSQIKTKINVSKSTLSIWLEKYPLSPERIRLLRDFNPRRIENCRNTKLQKRNARLDKIYKEMSREIGSFSNRDLFIAGLFLYWGEGTKAARDTVAFTNTDPNMLKFFIKWMKNFGIPEEKMRVKLHLYQDMDINEKIKFWSDELKIPKENFRKPYIKPSKYSSLTYKNSFGQGTCSIVYGNAELHNKIIAGLKYIRHCMDGKYKLV